MEKVCTKCGKIKPLSEFHKHKDHKDGYAYQCKECARVRNREWYAANKERVAARGRAWYEANKEWVAARDKAWYEANSERAMDTWLRRTYGISLPQYSEMLKTQDGGCAICGKAREEQVRRLSVDHDHETGQVRGLLCNTCNLGLGYFMHDPELLQHAIAYLGQWAKVAALEANDA